MESFRHQLYNYNKKAQSRRHLSKEMGIPSARKTLAIAKVILI